MDLRIAYAREKRFVAVHGLAVMRRAIRERMLVSAPDLLLVPDDGVPPALRERHVDIEARLTRNRSRPPERSTGRSARRSSRRSKRAPRRSSTATTICGTCEA